MLNIVTSRLQRSFRQWIATWTIIVINNYNNNNNNYYPFRKDQICLGMCSLRHREVVHRRKFHHRERYDSFLERSGSVICIRFWSLPFGKFPSHPKSNNQFKRRFQVHFTRLVWTAWKRSVRGPSAPFIKVSLKDNPSKLTPTVDGSTPAKSRMVGAQSMRCMYWVRCNSEADGMPGPVIKAGTRIPPSEKAPFTDRRGNAEPPAFGPLSDWKIMIVFASSPVCSSLKNVNTNSLLSTN